MRKNLHKPRIIASLIFIVFTIASANSAYALATHITATAGENGSVSPEDQIVPVGDTATVVITANSGYVVSKVTIVKLYDSATTIYTPNTETYTVNIVVDDAYTITAEFSDSGSGSSSDSASDDEGDYNSDNDSISSSDSESGGGDEYNSGSVEKAALTGNARSAGAVLDNIFASTSSGDVGVAKNAFDAMSATRKAEEAAKLTPESIMGSIAVAMSSAQAYADLMMSRGHSVRNTAVRQTSIMDGEGPDGPAGMSMRNENSWEVWTDTILSFGDQDSIDDKLGYQWSSTGFVIGADKVFDGWLGIFSIGYSESAAEADEGLSESDTDSLLFGVYGMRFVNFWYIEAGMGYSHNWSDTDRETALNRTAYSDDVASNLYSVFLGCGYDFNIGRLTFSPSLDMTYSYFTQESYSENGAGILSLNVDAFDEDSFQTTMGATVTYAFIDRFNAMGRLKWGHEYTDGATVIKSSFDCAGSSSFETTGLRQGRESFIGGVGLVYHVNDSTTASLDYDVQYMEECYESNLTFGIRFLF